MNTSPPPRVGWGDYFLPFLAGFFAATAFLAGFFAAAFFAAIVLTSPRLRNYI